MAGTTYHLLLHRVDGQAAVISTIHLFKAILTFYARLENPLFRCSVTMNVSALVALSWISIMLRPTHAKGELENVSTF